MSLQESHFGIIISLLLMLSIAAFISRGTAEPAPVMMTTDKKKYKKDDIITLKVTNRSDSSVWYISYSQPDLVFWTTEKYQNNDWRKLDVRLPFREDNIDICRVTLYERPIGIVMELKKHESLLYEWDKKICFHQSGIKSFPPDTIKPGRYKFALRYSLHTVQTEDVEPEPWKRPIELGETHLVYSDEFVLE